MKTIVETIQQEQDVAIRDMENDLLMVQGAAGSGKTSIALHRAAYLMYQRLQANLSADNIMIISPNSVFEQYISNVLPELEEDNIVSVVIVLNQDIERFYKNIRSLPLGIKLEQLEDYILELIFGTKKGRGRNSSRLLVFKNISDKQV